MNIPNAPLKGVFFMHFILSLWALQHSWLPMSYMYYNLIFMATLLWSLHCKDSEEPVFMALVIDGASVLLDIIVISIYYPLTHDYDDGDNFRFCAGMCILNLILRVVSIFVLLKIFRERGGHYDDLGIPGLPSGNYNDIDRHNQQSVPKTTVDTGSPTHDYMPASMPPPYQNP